MTTIVNSPPTTERSGQGVGMIVALVIMLLITYLFLAYGLPAIRQMSSPTINIPSEVDINVNENE